MKIIEDGQKVKYDGAIYTIEIFDTDEATEYWTLVMRTHGKDNRKLADIKQTIRFAGEKLSLIKEVKYKNTQDYFVRNKYHFSRNE